MTRELLDDMAKRLYNIHRAGQHRAYRMRACADDPRAMEAYDIEQHFSTEDCMVALRRKEVEK